MTVQYAVEEAEGKGFCQAVIEGLLWLPEQSFCLVG